MILKEFSFDLPYIKNDKTIKEISTKNNISIDEAIKLDYNNNWKIKRKEFSLMTRCITSMFERNFEGIDTKFWKIIIECVDEIKEEKIKLYGDVLFIQTVFDYENFIKLDDFNKKKIILNTLHDKTYEICNNHNLNFNCFKKVFNYIIENKYINSWSFIKKKIKNNVIISIEVEHNVYNVDIFLVIKDINENIMFKEKIVSDLPDEWAYSKHLGKLKINSSSEISFFNKKNSLIYSYHLK